jgi:hypothetical protein
MPKLVVLILGRIAFACLLILLALVGVSSLVSYPGPFVLTAFSVAGLPVWINVRGSQWIVALAIAALACVVPVGLLIQYSSDGDFGVTSLIVQCCVLALLAFGLAWSGIEAGRRVWVSRESKA